MRNVCLPWQFTYDTILGLGLTLGGVAGFAGGLGSIGGFGLRLEAGSLGEGEALTFSYTASVLFTWLSDGTLGAFRVGFRPPVTSALLLVVLSR